MSSEEACNPAIDNAGEEEQQAATMMATTDEEVNDKTLEILWNRVFNEELLLEKILDFAISCEETGWHESGLVTCTITRCRLVNKSWLLGVTKCLRKRRKPLFYLQIVQGTVVSDTAPIGQLRNFQNSLSSRIEGGRKPPIKLTIKDKEFFHQNNHRLFSEILWTAGEHLVELEMRLSRDGGSMVFIFPELGLPNLRKLRINLSARPVPVFEVQSLGNVNITYLLQAMINASGNLTELELSNVHYLHLIPSGFEYVFLPKTIRKVRFSVPTNCQALEVLMRNELPVLEYLDLYVVDGHFDGRWVSKLLNRFKRSLKRFDIDGDDEGMPRLPRDESDLLVVPKMEALERLDIACPYFCELGLNPQLEENLPKLKHLVLVGQTLPMFRKWLEGRKFETVEQLHVSLLPDVDQLEPVGFDEDVAASTHLAFPNLKILDWAMACTELGGLRRVFKDMRKLEQLRVLLQGSMQVDNSNGWDCLLTGLSTEEIAKWKENPEGFEPSPASGITNLTELRCLSLETTDTEQELPPDLLATSLISDDAFELALLKMPKLDELNFRGRFKISPEMVTKCEALDKEVHYEQWEHYIMPNDDGEDFEIGNIEDEDSDE